MALKFEILKKSGKSRLGKLHTKHGVVDTPAFMPVGTCGTVKAMMPESVAATGAQIGMIFPPWGVFIGAGVGLLVGAVLSVLGVFSSLPERVRKAQAKIQMQLEASRTEALAGAREAHHKLLSDLRGQVGTLVQAELEKLHALMKQPGEMVELQAQAMSRILRQLERMPHGIIQAVRH